MSYSDYTLDEFLDSLVTDPIGNFDPELLRVALETLEHDAVQSLLIELRQQLEASNIDPFTSDAIIDILVDQVVARNNIDAFQLLKLLIDIPTTNTGIIVNELSRIGGQEVVWLFRNILNSDDHFLHNDVARGIVGTQYADAVQALQDESELVRYMAVKRLDPGETMLGLRDTSENVRLAAAKKLETEENKVGLLETLEDVSSTVRRVGAWYVGRKQVKEAVEPLIELVQTEDDTETLRAALWSLGVLRDARALPHVEKLTRHDNPVIAKIADEVISKIAEANTE